MRVESYLSFDGRCEEAIEFYKEALGAEVTHLVRFKDTPDMKNCENMPPGFEDKIAHANLRIGESMVMASDGNCQGQPGFRGFSLSLSVADDAEAERVFAGLSEGGQVQMPLSTTFFASRFGMVADRFGVSWMVITAPQTEKAGVSGS